MINSHEGFLLLTRKGFVQEYDYRQPMIDALNLLQKHGLTKLNSDLSLIGAISTEDQIWCAL